MWLFMENCVIGEHLIEAKQTSAGVSRSSITIAYSSIMDAIALMHKAIEETIKVLEKHNRDSNGKIKSK